VGWGDDGDDGDDTEAMTAVEWAADERHVVCGDGKGTVSVTAVREPHATTTAVDSTTTSTRCVQVAGGAVVQLCAACSEHDRHLMVLSTRTASWVLCVRTLTLTAVGSKPRDGSYGALFHPLAWAAAPQPQPPHITATSSLTSSSVTSSSSSPAPAPPAWLLAARPGGRLWLVHTTHTHSNSTAATEDSSVVTAVRATLRLASLPPAQPLPWAPAGSTTVAAAAAAAPTMQFGRLLPLGSYVLSVSVRAPHRAAVSPYYSVCECAYTEGGYVGGGELTSRGR